GGELARRLATDGEPAGARDHRVERGPGTLGKLDRPRGTRVERGHQRTGHPRHGEHVTEHVHTCSVATGAHFTPGMRRTSKITALSSIERRRVETQAERMEINGTTALVTGSNRGLGRALVEALLDRGAARIYAAARDLATLTPLSSLPGAGTRVVPVRLDLTDPGQIAAAARTAAGVRLLVNNAGAAAFADPFRADRTVVAREMDTNYLGTFDVIRAFAPGMAAAGGGAVVNVLTLL